MGEGVSLCRVVSEEEEEEYAVLFAHAASKKASEPRPVPHTDCSSHKNYLKNHILRFLPGMFLKVSVYGHNWYFLDWKADTASYPPP